MISREHTIPDCWAFFDRIYCISLEERHDRREQARREFRAVGLEGRVEFVLVAPHPVDRARGIFRSHQICLRRALAAGAQRILVFEDDVFFQRFDPDRLLQACRTLARMESWDGFFPGCLTRGGCGKSGPGLERIHYHCLSHALALNRPFAERAATQPWTGLPYDTMLRRLGNDWYAPVPMFAFQGRGGSDNSTVAIDRMRRLFGGLARIQMINELYRRNRPLIVFLHLLILACLIILTTLLAGGSP